MIDNTVSKFNIAAYKNRIIPDYDNTTSFTNKDVCSKCGGRCCKTCGCHISPYEISFLTSNEIIQLIDNSGCISIDWWEGNPKSGGEYGKKFFYLRIRNKGAGVIDPTWGGECLLLTDTGCMLPTEYRPKCGRLLKPDLEGHCDSDYTKQKCAIEWMPYNHILEKVYCHYCDKEVSNIDLSKMLNDAQRIVINHFADKVDNEINNYIQSKENKVEQFISDMKKEFPEALEYTFYHGYCYWFALILSNRFNGKIWFNSKDVHFACMVGTDLYDVRGKIKFEWDSLTGTTGKENWTPWEDFQRDNYAAVQSIVDSCIKKVRKKEE